MLSYYGEVEARRLLFDIVSSLSARGWVLQTALDVAARTTRAEVSHGGLSARVDTANASQTRFISAETIWPHSRHHATGSPSRSTSTTPSGLAREFVKEYASLVFSSRVLRDYVAIGFRHRC